MSLKKNDKRDNKKTEGNEVSKEELWKESLEVKEPQVFVFGSSTESKAESSVSNFKGGNGCSEVMLDLKEKALSVNEDVLNKKQIELDEKIKSVEVKEKCLRDKEDAFNKKKIEFEEKVKSFDTKVIEMDQEKKKMEEELHENKVKMKKLVSELRSGVYCPVCLSVPTQGPVYVCPNGHTVCSTCKTTNCSICRTKMYDSTSLLAVTVINNIDHECPHLGCSQEVTLPDLKEHKRKCEHKPIACPSESCSLSVGYNQLLDHLITDCKYSRAVKRGNWIGMGKDNVICLDFTVPSMSKDILCGYEEWVDVFLWEAKFLVLLVRYSESMETSLSVLTFEENFSRYKVEITVGNTVKDKTLQNGISYSFKGQPNPITIRDKDDLVGLYLNKKSFDRVKSKSMLEVSFIVQLAMEKAVVQASEEAVKVEDAQLFV